MLLFPSGLMGGMASWSSDYRGWRFLAVDDPYVAVSSGMGVRVQGLDRGR